MHLVPTNDERNEATMETTNVNTDERAVIKVTVGSVVTGIVMFLISIMFIFVLSFAMFDAIETYGRWIVLSNGSVGFYLSGVAARVIGIAVISLALIIGAFLGFGISRNFGFLESEEGEDEDKDEKD